MLKTRIATAIGLLAVLLPSLFLLTQVQWALLMAAATAIAAWEWGGLVQWASGKRVAYGIALGLLAVGLTVGRPQLVEVTQTDEAIALYLPALAFWLLV
ncbi:MAG TPA: phosphatidate cytidylyltransferase, partial [Rhodocyclaceae bacterium]|nr:phosphatidate cytidylyltransferase [Rhodocyclaceae bacterium]